MRAEPDAVAAFAAGAAVAGLAGVAGWLWLRGAMRRAGSLKPQAVLGATALRFAVTLAGAVTLVVLWRTRATAALAGVGAGYLALLVVETRWAMTMGTTGRPRAGREQAEARED